jgi:hypothetical protein
LYFKQYVVVVSDNVDYAVHATRVRVRADYAGPATLIVYAADNRSRVPHLVAVARWRGTAIPSVHGTQSPALDPGCADLIPGCLLPLPNL